MTFPRGTPMDAPDPAQPTPSPLSHRIASTIIDGLILLAILAGILIGTGVAANIGNFSANQNALVISLALTPFGYYLLTEGLFGASPGKFFQGLRVYRLTGERAGFGGIFMRNLTRIFYPVPGAGQMLAIVEIVMVLSNKQRRRVGDFMGGTIVALKKHTVSYDYQPPPGETPGAPPV